MEKAEALLRTNKDIERQIEFLHSDLKEIKEETKKAQERYS